MELPAYNAAGDRMKNQLLLALCLLTVLAFFAFVALRHHQLSLPDNYNNPFTDLSTGCLLAFFIFWLATAMSAPFLWKHSVLVAKLFAVAVLLAGGLFIFWFFTMMIRFMTNL
jgi:hypothetical protein